MDDRPGKRKVTAFVVRSTPQGTAELLIHTFADAPFVPARLPGGGIEPDETPEQAVYREVREETGLADFEILRKLGVQSYYKAFIHAPVERHDFLLCSRTAVPDTWSHDVTGTGDDADEVFHYRWVDGTELASIDPEHARFLTPDYVPELFPDDAERSDAPTSGNSSQRTSAQHGIAPDACERGEHSL